MESVKRDFYNELQHYTIIINSSHGKVDEPSLDYDLSLRLSRPTIQTWYGTWTRQSKDLLRDHLSTRRLQPYARAILTGGGAQSEFYRNDITDFLLREYGIKTPHSLTVTLPCSKGGLTQHVLERDSLPATCYWYITQGETYNKSLHRDAKRKPHLRQESEYSDGEVKVHHRLIRLMSYAAKTGFRPRQRLLQTFKVYIEPLGRLHLAIYWSTDRRPEHSSAYNPEGRRKKGLRSHPVMFDSPDLGTHGFQLYGHGEEPYYIVMAFVEMQGDESSLHVTATILDPTFLKSDKFDESKIWTTFSDEIWTPSSSAFVSQGTGATGARCRSDIQSSQHILPTTEGGSDRLRSVSVFASDYGSLDSSDPESDQSSAPDVTGQEVPDARFGVDARVSTKKRAFKDVQQSSIERGRSSRLPVPRKRHTKSQGSVRNPRQRDTAVGSEYSPPFGFSFHSDRSPESFHTPNHSARSAHAFRAPGLSRQPGSDRSSTVRRSSSPVELQGRQHDDMLALLQKVEE
jgi:hypothetical protein